MPKFIEPMLSEHYPPARRAGARRGAVRRSASRLPPVVMLRTASLACLICGSRKRMKTSGSGIGRPVSDRGHGDGGWRRWLRPSLADRLSGDVPDERAARPTWSAWISAGDGAGDDRLPGRRRPRTLASRDLRCVRRGAGVKIARAYSDRPEPATVRDRGRGSAGRSAGSARAGTQHAGMPCRAARFPAPARDDEEVLMPIGGMDQADPTTITSTTPNCDRIVAVGDDERQEASAPSPALTGADAFEEAAEQDVDHHQEHHHRRRRWYRCRSSRRL